MTPYWASNSAGKIRAIVNTQHFEQAIHQEVCTYVCTLSVVGFSVCSIIDLFVGKCKQVDAAVNVAVNKNISGIVCWPTIQTMIAKVYSWTGSYSRPVVYAVAVPRRSDITQLQYS